MLSRARHLLWLLVALALPVAAGATHLPPTIMFDVQGGAAGTQVNSLGSSSPLPGGDGVMWTLSSPSVIEGVSIDSWTATLKEDPFVTNNIVVTNNTASTQTFIATVLLPIPSFNYNAVINSSVGVTVTDSNGNGVMSFANSAATPVYVGTVNGSGVLSMDPVGMPIILADCTPSFPGCTATSSNGVALFAASGTATQIGITLTFDLSAGDSAGVTSRFEIVPEPATLALTAAGLLGVAVVARRRRS